MTRRRPGTGACFKSKARDRWVAQVSLPGPPRRFVTRWCRSRDDARIALAQLLDQYAIAPAPDARLPLREYVDGWFRTSGAHLAASSKDAYRRRIASLLALLGTIPIGRLRKSDLDRYSALEMAKGTSASSRAAALTTLGTILQSACDDGALPRNVAHDARKPTVARAEVRAMPLAEAKAILDLTRDDAIGPVVALLLGSGLRLGEALGLDWGDIDFNEGSVHVRSGKTPRSRRTAPITAIALEALRPRRQLAGQVFELPRWQVQRRLKALMIAAGMKPRHPHELRHGHATLLLTTGTDMRVIADQLGHTKPSMTANVYAHVEQAAQRAAVDRLDAALTDR